MNNKRKMKKRWRKRKEGGGQEEERRIYNTNKYRHLIDQMCFFLENSWHILNYIWDHHMTM